MIPLRDENPTRSVPVVTLLIIGLNAVAFFLQMGMGLEISTVAYGLIPAELIHNANEVYGAREIGLRGDLAVRNLDPAWMTVFSSMFMHGSWLHILGNMWFLWIFGNNIEDAMGKPKFLGFYLAGGVVRAAVGLDRGGDPEDPQSNSELAVVARLIRERARVDPAKLADEGTPLADVAVAASAPR